LKAATIIAVELFLCFHVCPPFPTSDEMININKWENPVMYKLEGYVRTEYNGPSGSSNGSHYGSSGKCQ
jgi:hypothetical protein